MNKTELRDIVALHHYKEGATPESSWELADKFLEARTSGQKTKSSAKPKQEKEKENEREEEVLVEERREEENERQEKVVNEEKKEPKRLLITQETVDANYKKLQVLIQQDILKGLGARNLEKGTDEGKEFMNECKKIWNDTRSQLRFDLNYADALFGEKESINLQTYQKARKAIEKLD